MVPSPVNAMAYTVVATFPGPELAREYVEWLEDGHIDAVIRGGAHSAMIVRVIDPPTPIRVEVRYIFSNQQVFDTYLAQHAPALRAQGLKRFPAERGIRFERTLGAVV